MEHVLAGFGSTLVPEGRALLTISDAVVALPGLTALTYGVVIRFENGPARYVVVGPDPTASDGTPVNDGDVIVLCRAEALGFKAVRSAGVDMKAHVVRYRVGP